MPTGGTLLLAFFLSAAGVPNAARAAAFPAQDPGTQDPGQYQDPNQSPDQGAYPDQAGFQNFTPEQLDNLLAPIALYPDPLLAQVLLAATFPDQIDEAARFVRGGGAPADIDYQPWDVSVKAVARYPSVLDMMDNRLDWTTSLGQAYVNQSTDVQESIQRLRAMAHDAGTLESGPQMQVVEQDGNWCIWPAQPQFIYVPVYDPAVVFFGRPRVWFGGPFISFGVGFPIGAWFNYDFDWGHHRIFYHGWEGGHLAPWAVRSRPYVHITNVYVNDRYRNVEFNRTVNNRRVNVENLNRYNSIHRDVRYSNVAVNNLQRQSDRNQRPMNNATLQRNINPNDPRLNNFRGREGTPAQEAGRQQFQPGGQPQFRPQTQPRPEVQQRPQPESKPQPEFKPQPPVQRGPEVRPQYTPPRSAYNVEPRPFDPRQSSARGQVSRQEMSRPPAARPSSAPRGGGGGKRP